MWSDLIGIAAAGAISGPAKIIVSHPLDTVKLHLQHKRIPPKTLRGLSRGITLPIIRNGIEGSTPFLFRALVSELIEAAAGSTSSSMMSGANNPWLVGLLAGVPQSICNTPIDYARVQLELGQPLKLINCYRGFPCVAAKEASSGMMFFGMYEGLLSTGVHGGIAGSTSALSAMVTTYQWT
jgi:hypothetical protein